MGKMMVCLLLAALLCIGTDGALAAKFGEAVIDRRSAARVHLREQATVKSDSMGLYYTGTPVDCLSDPDEEWVHIRIGVEEGYMMGRYLRTGSRADRVVPVGPTGYVDVKNYIRLRRGPSTEYKMLAALQAGTSVTIMGETDSNWYYVDVDGEDGYVSAKLITLHGQMPREPKENADQVSLYTIINRAYCDWVIQNGSEDFKYDLIYLDSDDVPELAVHTGAEAGGCYVLSYGDGAVHVLHTSRTGLSYIPGRNLLLNSDGLMDQYYDNVYCLEDGRWKPIATGNYYGAKGGWSEEQGRYICQTYVWNGRQVSMEAYLQSLDQVYSRNDGVRPEYPYSHVQILTELSR